MKDEIIYNSNMHFEHQQWKGELDFWKGELKIFNNKLDELVKRSTNKNTLAKLEHYQNEFILHKTAIKNMLGAIEDHEDRIVGPSKKNIDILDLKSMKKHGDLRNELEEQRHIYSNLKKGFFRFLQKTHVSIV